MGYYSYWSFKWFCKRDEPAVSDLWGALVIGWAGHLLERLQILSVCVMIALVDVCLMSKDG